MPNYFWKFQRSVAQKLGKFWWFKDCNFLLGLMRKFSHLFRLHVMYTLYALHIIVHIMLMDMRSNFYLSLSKIPWLKTLKTSLWQGIGCPNIKWQSTGCPMYNGRVQRVPIYNGMRWFTHRLCNLLSLSNEKRVAFRKNNTLYTRGGRQAATSHNIFPSMPHISYFLFRQL